MPTRRSLAGLIAATALLGFGGLGGAPPAALAQDAGPSGEELFGTYALEARGLGVEASYEIEGLLPGGSPVLDLGIPETLARFGSGPTGYGLASLAYPGGVIVSLPSLVEQSGGDASQVPPYPIKAEAFFPAGPTEVDESQPGATVQKVVSGPRGVEAAGSFPGVAADPAVNIGSITSASRSSIEEGLAVARTRVELGDVSILGGVITIESIVTDLVAAHDEAAGAATGGTKVSGVSVLGLAASFTDEGLVLEEAPPTSDPANPLDGVLNPAVGPLAGALAPVQDALAEVLAQATPQVDDLLAQAGVVVKLIEPTTVDVASGAVGRFSTGLSVTLRYAGREQAALRDLIASVPDELKPNIGPIPNPVTFLVQNHITGFNLAPASVSALATAPFEIPDISFVPAPVDPGSVVPGTPGEFVPPSFGEPVPAIPESQAGGPLTTSELSNLIDGALPALLVIAALMLAAFSGVGTTRLADNVLAPISRSCPAGLDQPPPRST